MRAVNISHHGGPDVLQAVETASPQVSSGSVLVRNRAIGVNYVDVQHRQGVPYRVPLPLIPGIEAAGVVEQVGEDVTTFKPGDRVAYAGYMGGNYAELTLVPEDQLAPIPDGLDFERAAAGLMHGMTAHCLANDAFQLQPGHWVLIHAAAGGVGSMLVQFAKQQGATVIGTVSSEQKAAFARNLGVDYTINYRDQDFLEVVNTITQNKGVHVVYDAIGQATFDQSLAALKRCGHLVIYGQTGGAVPPFDVNRLSGLTDNSTRGSISLTWAALSHFNADHQTFLDRAQIVFDLIQSGAIQVHISHRIPLENASAAHRLLENRNGVGKIILVP